jgi:hypothetical protein
MAGWPKENFPAISSSLPPKNSGPMYHWLDRPASIQKSYGKGNKLFYGCYGRYTRVLRTLKRSLWITCLAGRRPKERKETPGRYQRLVLFIKVLSLLCPNLTVASLFF